MSETLDSQVLDAKRPTFLTVLCVLTFISSGLGTLLYLLVTVASGVFIGLMSSVPGMELLAGAGVAFFAGLFILSGLSLLGAIMMWKLKKTGYFLYVAANIIAFILPIAVLGIPFDIVSLLLVLIFIVLYGLNLKHMR